MRYAVAISPNPADKELKIKIKATNEDKFKSSAPAFEIKLVDKNGFIAYSNTKKSFDFVIERGNLNSGYYILIINSESYTYSTKIVFQGN